MFSYTFPMLVGGVQYYVADIYKTNLVDKVTTDESYSSDVYVKDSSSSSGYSKVTDDNTLYEMDNDTSNEKRDTEGNRIKNAVAGSGKQRYVSVDKKYVANTVYDKVHYEYTMKNTNGTPIMTGKSSSFIDTSVGVRDSVVDAGNDTTNLPSKNIENTIKITDKYGYQSYIDTNLRSDRNVVMSGKDNDGVTQYTRLRYDDIADTNTTGNRETTVTFNPAGNASRSFTKTSKVGGTASETGFYIDVVPPEKLIHIQSGALAFQNIPIRYSALNNTILGISGVRTLTYSQSQDAINAFDRAIEKISMYRTKFGAQQNRLEHAMAVDDNTAENTDAAESRIRDTDMAEEMVNYSKHNILEQVGQSMISQANQTQQGVLSILG